MDINILEPLSAPTFGKDFHREYSPVRFEVLTDSDTTGWPEVLSAIGIGLFSPHPADSQAYCVNIKPQRDENHPRYWIVEYQYSTRIDITVSDGGGGQPQPQTQANPLDRKGRIRMSTRRYQEALIKDINGDPIRNTALDPYEHVEDKALLTIQIQRNLPLSQYGNIPAFNPLTIADFVGAINSTAFLGFANREVLCDDLEAEPKQESGGPAYWDVNALFVIKPFRGTGKALRGGWVTRKLNAGYRELVAGAWVPITESGQRPARPALLKLDGTKMNPGTPASPTEPLFNLFFTKPEKDFNQLGLLL